MDAIGQVLEVSQFDEDEIDFHNQHLIQNSQAVI
jgi:hypothetical protein